MGNTVSKAAEQFLHRVIACGAKKKKSRKSDMCSDKTPLEQPTTMKNSSTAVTKSCVANQDRMENIDVCENNGNIETALVEDYVLVSSRNQQKENTAMSVENVTEMKPSSSDMDKYTCEIKQNSKEETVTSDLVNKQELNSSTKLLHSIDDIPHSDSTCVNQKSCSISSEISSCKSNSSFTHVSQSVMNHVDLLKNVEENTQTLTDPISQLEMQQAAIFARLKRIQDELDKMSCGSECQESSQTSGPVLDNVKFQDLVIGVDPNSIPLSILILYQELSRSLKVKPTIYVHSSVEKKPSPKLRNLFDLATPLKKPEDSRLSNDLLLTIIYKNVRQGCSLMVNPEKQTFIYGEVNIARYFSRLINPSYDKDPVQSTLIDAWVDKASLLLYNGNAEQKNEMIKVLDTTLSKRKWLVGHDLSLADIVSWSGIQKNKLAKLVSPNVEVWMKTCASHPMFSFVNKVLSQL